jgi:hypothetical protein
LKTGKLTGKRNHLNYFSSEKNKADHDCKNS